MNLSAPFIRRPVATMLLSLAIFLLGGVSFGLFRADADLARWALAAFSIAVAIFLATWVRNTTRRLSAVALGLVIGTALLGLINSRDVVRRPPLEVLRTDG